MLPQNPNKTERLDEFVILPDFCLHCEAEVKNKIIERNRFNTPKTITFEYFCGAILTSTNCYVDKTPTVGHVVTIKAGCKNSILEGFNKLSKGTLEDHRIRTFKD